MATPECLFALGGSPPLNVCYKSAPLKAVAAFEFQNSQCSQRIDISTCWCQTSDLCGPRLEYLHGVTRWILDKDLMSGRPIDNLAAELHSLRPEVFDNRTDISDRNLEAVPAARCRGAPGDSRATDAWFVQEQPKIAPSQARESGRARQIDGKAEPVAVKLGRRFNILDEIADSYLCHW
jgi:hypothetical protein